MAMWIKDGPEMASGECQVAIFGEDFQQAIITCLNFDEKYQALVEQLVVWLKKHAVLVGSGTVARSASRTLEDKAALAVMAWMRHQIIAYDSTSVPRAKGYRGELRHADSASIRTHLSQVTHR